MALYVSLPWEVSAMSQQQPMTPRSSTGTNTMTDDSYQQLHGYNVVDNVIRRREWEAAHPAVRIAFREDLGWEWSASWATERGTMVLKDTDLGTLLDRLDNIFRE